MCPIRNASIAGRSWCNRCNAISLHNRWTLTLAVDAIDKQNGACNESKLNIETISRYADCRDTYCCLFWKRKHMTRRHHRCRVHSSAKRFTEICQSSSMCYASSNKFDVWMMKRSYPNRHLFNVYFWIESSETHTKQQSAPDVVIIERPDDASIPCIISKKHCWEQPLGRTKRMDSISCGRRP